MLQSTRVSVIVWKALELEKEGTALADIRLYTVFSFNMEEESIDYKDIYDAKYKELEIAMKEKYEAMEVVKQLQLKMNP